jgi:hypothetical protein
LDKKITGLLSGLLEGVRGDQYSDKQLKMMKILFGPKKTFPKNYFFEMENLRLTFTNNGLTEK